MHGNPTADKCNDHYNKSAYRESTFSLAFNETQKPKHQAINSRCHVCRLYALAEGEPSWQTAACQPS
jgi:hypothetical protein